MYTRRQFLQSSISLASGALFFQKSQSINSSQSNFDHALLALQSHPKFANSSVANDEPIIAANSGPERAPIRAAKSITKISDRASELIVASEVSSRAAYTKLFEQPVWPRGTSGVTIGIGYDLGASTLPYFMEDWSHYLDQKTIASLSPACGVTGRPASDLVTKFRQLSIPWESAIAQYKAETLPRYVGETERALKNTAKLSPDSLGALVSLVYNRGPAFHMPDERFREMRAVGDHMSSLSFVSISGDIRSMERLWRDQPSFRGVVLRREAEASLFELGLDS